MDYRRYSRLPEAPEYWAALAARIEQPKDDGRSWLRAASIVALLSAAAAAIAFMIPAPPRQPTDLASALAPGDPVAALFMETK